MGRMRQHHAHCTAEDFGRGISPADEIELLEEYQRDLEEAVADVASRIKRLRELESDDAAASTTS